MHTNYKIIQQFKDKLFLLVNQLSRHNIFATCKKTPIGIGNKNHFNRPLQSQHAHLIIGDVQDIPKKLCVRNKAETVIQRNPIIMTNADYDYILDEIECREKISLKGMGVLRMMMNHIDDNNNNAIFNVVLC